MVDDQKETTRTSEEKAAGPKPADTAAAATLPPEAAAKPTPKVKETAAQKLFILSSSPHLKSDAGVPTIMWLVSAALTPAVFSGVFYFGLPAVQLILAAIAAALLTEALVDALRRRRSNLRDGSAFLTGLLLALTLPPSLSPWFAALGSAFAILVGKQLFGGLGYNIFNPALIGRAFLQASFPVEMTTWVAPRTIDAITTATPLGSFKFEQTFTPYGDLLLGNIGGCIGETSALAVLLGGLFILIKGYADWRIPLSFLGTVALLGGVFWLIAPGQYPDPVFHLLAGGLMLGAFFMATDMVSSPITPKGTWIYGIGCGALLIMIRIYGGLPEGVMYAILLMNGAVPLIDRYTRPRFFGERRL